MKRREEQRNDPADLDELLVLQFPGTNQHKQVLRTNDLLFRELIAELLLKLLEHSVCVVWLRRRARIVAGLPRAMRGPVLAAALLCRRRLVRDAPNSDT